ncbi:isochorismatase family protein [Aquabacterium sp. OR-4]|uniref:isochorismatase family protein n=1 Tax=Aquabacterium sp. OR-4 TaxID=2978127 RepID=UPI0021B2B09B|nr:isochorismatase family protein [Aquabacterium sp. OR-4]MDT7838241.1 isochorismatase family protein [Aquabacterium sp. OR-4]
MATVRDGHQPVLLVVDVQVGVMAAAWQAPRVIANVAHTVAQARAQGVPVIWVQHQNHELQPGTPAWQWVPELVPAASERLIAKQFNSAFEDTPLVAELAALGATHIVLAGAASGWCIRATAYAALERGYDLTLVSDAHSTETLVLDGGQRVEAESVVHDLNTAMTWLRYPGRGNAAVAAAQLSFAAPPTGPAT